MLANVYALGTPRLVHQLMWASVVNIHGGLGHNISLDLHMEHMNKKLKECVGENVTEKLLVRSGKPLKGIMEVCKHFNDICQLQPLSSQYTLASSMKDIDTKMDLPKMVDNRIKACFLSKPTH